jgi:PAS domain S-box-containing protein
LALRWAFAPLLRDTVPYFTVWSAVAFSAWYCGLGPSILTAISSALGVWFYFLPPYHSFAIVSASDAFSIIGFLLLSGVIVGLGEVNRRAQSARFHQANLLDLANDAIIELDAGDDTIKYWNRGAEKLYGWKSSEALGKNIHTLLKTVFPVSLDESKALLKRQGQWAGEAIHTRRDGAQIDVATRWSLQDVAGETTWLEINRDITDRKKTEQELHKAYSEMESRVKERTAELEEANQSLRRLSVRLLESQDDERRKIARELHDSAGQYLAAIGMSVDSVRTELKNQKLPGSLNPKLEEVARMTEACISEIRTLAHLLHPPLLEELGLASAVRWYVEGFSTRSGISADLQMPEELGRLGSEIEIVLFRVLQESLTNIHRHSGNKKATIKLDADQQHAWIEIQDQGNGNGGHNPRSFRPGVGITGMRERLKALSGALEITSDGNGTCVKAVIPLTRKPSASI